MLHRAHRPPDGKLGQVGRDWLPPLNAVIRQPEHLLRSTRFDQIAAHTARQFPSIDKNGFRWDKPSDGFKRFGGKPPFPYVPDPVLDQGACGSCWAFSVATVHTARLRIWTQTEIPQLSPTPILSCVTSTTSKGCSGGLPAEAAEYCLSVGLPSLDCADYNWCSYKTEYCSTNPKATATGGCACSDADRPACSSYKSTGGGGCTTCACTANPDATACARTTCTTTDGTPFDVYSYIGTKTPAVSLMTVGSTHTDDLSDLQLRIMAEMFQHGPVQANYFVMADFYLSTINADTTGSGTSGIGPLWESTGGIYMNVPDADAALYPTLPGAELLQCQYCPQNTAVGCSTKNVPAATCMLGGHAVAIIGYGSRRVKTANYSSIRGPLELLAHTPNPNADVLCYWICQNSWGPEWNANQPDLNADGLSGGKWFHAMSGTYEFTHADTGQTSKYAVNMAIGLDHTITTLNGHDLGGTFGGVLTWDAADTMAPFPFRSNLADKIMGVWDTRVESSDDLVPCGSFKFTQNGVVVPSGCAMVPAKLCAEPIEGGGATCDDTGATTTTPKKQMSSNVFFVWVSENKNNLIWFFLLLLSLVFVLGITLFAVHSMTSRAAGNPTEPTPPKQPEPNGFSNMPSYSPTQIVIQGPTSGTLSDLVHASNKSAAPPKPEPVQTPIGELHGLAREADELSKKLNEVSSGSGTPPFEAAKI